MELSSGNTAAAFVVDGCLAHYPRSILAEAYVASKVLGAAVTVDATAGCEVLKKG